MPKRQDFDEELDGVDDATSTGEGKATNQKAAGGETKSKNWQDDPEYRRIQSETDQRIAAAERRAAQLEQQYHQDRMEKLEGADKLAYQNQLLQQELQRVNQQRELEMWAMQRSRDLADIATRTGVQLRDIEAKLPQGASVHDAWLLAQDLKEQQATKPGKRKQVVVEDDDDDEPDDSVDMGTSKAVTTKQQLQAGYDKHRKLFNVREQLEYKARADELGITINEW